ncbi:MAG: alpha/beta fold hydrolase [Halomonas sp.]|nr:alpha/beta fold hydrolase [Halomonas sp.]MDN6336897.1 alpha/beta fold hydrolase [Halomonas sp.]
MKYVLGFVLIAVIGLAVVMALLIVLGGPAQPAPVASINAPFKQVDYSDLPALAHYTARDDTALGFRLYPPEGDSVKGSVILLHGSSADSRSMHPLAKAFAADGYTAYTLDVRGHGQSGTKGDTDYIGQLEDDLEAFMDDIEPAEPATLVGFSSGGGFALRMAGSQRQQLFSRYLLLSPFISQNAPTYRDNGSDWMNLGLPRYIAITLLNAAGIRHFNHLPVIRFALDDAARETLTPAYSYALAQNYRPRPDYQATIRSVYQPLRVVAGQEDELLHTERFSDVFNAAGKDVPVTLVPSINHIGLTLEPQGIQAAVNALRQLAH